MPAAKPSRPALDNAIRAVLDNGLTPTAVVVDPAGGFRIEFDSVRGAAVQEPRSAPEQLLTWDDVA